MCFYLTAHTTLAVCTKHNLPKQLQCCTCSQGWLKQRSPQEAEVLRELFSSSFSDLYHFSVQSLEFKMEMLEAFIIMQCINMLQGLIPPKVKFQLTKWPCMGQCWFYRRGSFTQEKKILNYQITGEIQRNIFFPVPCLKKACDLKSVLLHRSSVASYPESTWSGCMSLPWCGALELYLSWMIGESWRSGSEAMTASV